MLMQRMLMNTFHMLAHNTPLCPESCARTLLLLLPFCCSWERCQAGASRS
jgi:hypothetical protein